jgi:16S rRNA (guanine527-N7)-methyltransferase
MKDHGAPLAHFSTEARKILGTEISQSALGQFGAYLNLLADWNQVHNLAGSSDPWFIIKSLFLESLFFLHLVPEGPIRLVDVGSGAGFPGVPMRIIEPKIRLTLVESRRKRASFLSALRRHLALDDVVVWHGRAEELARERPGFDAVTMRAVAGMDRCLSMGLPLLAPTGRLLASVPPRTEPGRLSIAALPPGVRAEIRAVSGAQGEQDRRFLVATHVATVSDEAQTR